MKNKRENIFLRICCHIIFIIYFILLVKIILFKYRGLISTFDSLFAGELSGFHSFNIIPFQSILEFTKLMFSGYFSRGFINIIGNILVFAPFGYFIPLLYKKFQNIITVISAGFFVSVVFEVCQYFLYLGSFDIDDIILNSLGTISGFLFFKLINKITHEKHTERYAVTIILSIVGFIAAGHLAADYFGIMFGIRGHKSQVNNDNDLPGNLQIAESSDNAYDDEFDMWGDITSFDDLSVTINKTDIEDLENGMSVATMNVENPDLETVYMTETTKYTQKDIYDVNGDRVETRKADKEDLEIGKHINIKGYRSDNKLFAAEIIINNYLFM